MKSHQEGKGPIISQLSKRVVFRILEEGDNSQTVESSEADEKRQRPGPGSSVLLLHTLCCSDRDSSSTGNEREKEGTYGVFYLLRQEEEMES